MTIEELERQAEICYGLPYKYAKEIGVSEFTFCKMLREEFDVETRQTVLQAIDRLANK